MLDFENLAEVRSAIDQIDQLIVGLQAQRDACLQVAADFIRLEGHEPADQAPAQSQAQAQCAPCYGLR